MQYAFLRRISESAHPVTVEKLVKLHVHVPVSRMYATRAQLLMLRFSNAFVIRT